MWQLANTFRYRTCQWYYVCHFGGYYVQYRTGSNMVHYFIESIYYNTHYSDSQIVVLGQFDHLKLRFFFFQVISKLRTCKLVFVIKDSSIDLILFLDKKTRANTLFRICFEGHYLGFLSSISTFLSFEKMNTNMYFSLHFLLYIIYFTLL